MSAPEGTQVQDAVFSTVLNSRVLMLPILRLSWEGASDNVKIKFVPNREEKVAFARDQV